VLLQVDHKNTVLLNWITHRKNKLRLFRQILFYRITSGTDKNKSLIGGKWIFWWWLRKSDYSCNFVTLRCRVPLSTSFYAKIVSMVRLISLSITYCKWSSVKLMRKASHYNLTLKNVFIFEQSSPWNWFYLTFLLS